MTDREVRVRIWITEPDGRDVEVEQAMPVPNDDGAHITAVLDSVVAMVRARYTEPAQPFVTTFPTYGGFRHA